MAGDICIVERFIMDSIRIKRGFVLLSILSVCSCQEPIGEGFSLFFHHIKCESLHVSAKSDRELTLWVKVSGPESEHEKHIEGLVSDYMSVNYGNHGDGGSVIRDFYYCSEVCTSVKIVSDVKCRGIEPFNDLSEYFSVSAPSDYYGEELVITSERVIGKIKSIPLVEFIDYKPFMVPIMLFNMIIVDDQDYTGAHFTVTIDLDNGKSFTSTVEIP